MSDSNSRERLDAKHERDRERRIEAVKRWVAYIESEPPEKWGRQQNAIVDGQLEAAQSVPISAAHQRQVRTVAAEIVEAKDDSNDTPE